MSGTMDETNPFVEWLADELLRRGWKPEDLAREMGVDSSGINNILHRKRNLGTDLAKKMAAALGISQVSLYKEARLIDDEPAAKSGVLTELLIAIASKLNDDDLHRLLDTANAWARSNEERARAKAQRPQAKRAQ